MHWDDIPPVVNYLYVAAPGHPLAAKNGRLPLHRWLLYRRLGSGPHPCHWCGVLVDWLFGRESGTFDAALLVDHVDRNRGNNEERNLVPSCRDCNLRRGGSQQVRPKARKPVVAPRPPVVRWQPGTEAERFAARLIVTDTCWLWGGAMKDVGSYGRFLTDTGHEPAHRYAWVVAAGAEPGPGLHVLHTCDVPACVRTDQPGIYVVDGIAYPRFGHLWLGSHAANMADRKAKLRYRRMAVTERQPRGERKGNAKLTEQDVREIRRLLADGETLRAIASSFGVSKGPITMISRGKSWRHVE